MSEHIRIPEAAERLNCSERTLREWCSHNKIKAKKVAGKWLIPEEVINRKVGQSETVTTKPPNDIGSLVDLLRRWQEQAQFENLDNIVWDGYFEVAKLQTIRAITQPEDEAKEYIDTLIHHAKDSERPVLESLPVEQEGLFYWLKIAYSENAIWDIYDYWHQTFTNYYDALNSWSGFIYHVYQHLINGEIADEVPKEKIVKALKGYPDAITVGEEIIPFYNWLVPLILSYDLLTRGLAEQPSKSLFFLQVHRLSARRNQAIMIGSKFPIPLSEIQNNISEMADIFWEHFEHIRDNVKVVLQKLSDYKTAHDDLHEKIIELEQCLYVVPGPEEL